MSIFSKLFRSKPKKSIISCEPSSSSITRTFSVSHFWTIENFVQYYDEAMVNRPSIRSGTFSISQEQTTEIGHEVAFELICYPKGSHQDYADYTGMYLQVNCTEETQIKYRFSNLDSKNKSRRGTKGYFRKCAPNDTKECGVHKWIRCEDLLKPENCYLSQDGGNFTVFCEIDILISKMKYTDFSKKNQANDDFCDNFGKYLKKHTFSDVSLEVGEGKVQLRAHKAILSSRSPVFEAMFSHANTREALESRVEIPDMSEVVCQEMLRYVYTGKVESLVLHAEQLLPVADKYQINHLKEQCEQILCTQLSPEKAKPFFQLAILHKADQLRCASLEFIQKQNLEALKRIMENPELAMETSKFIQDLNET